MIKMKTIKIIGLISLMALILFSGCSNQEIKSESNYFRPELCNGNILVYDMSNEQHLIKISCLDDVIRIYNYNKSANTFYLMYQSIEIN